MKKNKLYTVTKFNKPLFAPEENLFPNGGNIAVWDRLASKQYGAQYGEDGSTMKDYMNSTNLFGISKADNPFSKGNLAGGPKAMLSTGISKGIAGAVGGLVGNAAFKGISGGLSSGAGSAINSIGSTVGGAVGAVNPIAGAAITAASGIIGGITNAAFGKSVDQKRLNEANESIAKLNSFDGNKSSFDEIKGPEATASVEDIYQYGFLNGDHSEQEELEERMRNAKLFADRSITNNVNNLASDQMNNALANYSAFGGPLDFGGGALGLMQQNRYFDTIDKRSEAIAGKGQTMQTGFTGGAKTFAGGGDLAASFLDTFGSDPIGAAIRYNQGLEQLAAQREAAQAEAAREQEYVDMQKRLLSLETQNQGLQAMIDALPTASTAPDIPEEPAAYSTSSRAVSGGSTWSYIEEQLRRSGKFNDTQIQGIKYNLQRESSLDPTVVGDGGAAFGLGQWHGSRKPKDMSLEGQTRHLIDTISNFDGKEHWISKKDYEGFLNARTPEEAHYYLAKGYERPRADIVAKVKRDSDMSLSRLKAFGGELGTNGTDFTNGLLYIDGGGTHEENPLDGVPMGLDPEGIPNLVEEGETVYNDYVFSDRMNVPDFMLKDLGLPKSKKGISFADASKKLAQESEKRPNDPISQDGLQASLSRLAEIQETERMRKQAEEYMGLEGYACGGNMKHKFDFGGLAWIKKNHPEIKNPEVVAKALEQHMQSNRGNFYAPDDTGLFGGGDKEYKWQFERAWNDLMPATTSLGNAEKHFNKWVKAGLDRETAFRLAYSDRIYNQYQGTNRDSKKKEYDTAYDRLVTQASKPRTIRYRDKAGNIHATREEAIKANDAARRARIAAQQKTANNNTTSQSTSTSQQPDISVQNAKKAAEEARTQRQAAATKSVNVPKNTGTTDYSSNRNYGQKETNGPAIDDNAKKIIRGSSMVELANNMGLDANPKIDTDLPEQGVMLVNPDNDGDEYTGSENRNPYDTWMRYAPAVGAGIMTLTDALGLTNKPDYTYAAGLEAAANRAGYAPNINYEPIGDYLRYNPMDIWYQQNALNAQSRATDRSIMNTGINPGNKMAGLLANGYNSQIASGNLYRQALEYNDAQREKVADFNRRTNMFNSQMGLEAAMANARYQQAASQMGLSGLAQAAALRDSIDQRVGASRSANLTNFLNSLGNIGRENFAFNMVDSTKAANNGYGYSGRDGSVDHRTAFGGKIKKHKK